MTLFYCLTGKGYEAEPVTIDTDGSWSNICVQAEQATKALLLNLFLLEDLVRKTASAAICIFTLPI